MNAVGHFVIRRNSVKGVCEYDDGDRFPFAAITHCALLREAPYTFGNAHGSGEREPWFPIVTPKGSQIGIAVQHDRVHKGRRAPGAKTKITRETLNGHRLDDVPLTSPLVDVMS